MSIGLLKEITVDAFPHSQRRPWLFKELERLHSYLCGVNAHCELWVDGSFLTEKLEPDDIDLCFSCFAIDFDKLPRPVARAIWTNLNGGKKYSPHLDTYLCFRFLSEDPRAHADGTNDWSEKWGVGWDDHLTGFAVIKLGETNVSLSLLA